MKTSAVTLDDLRGVFAVPPLARAYGPRRPIDLAANDVLLRHMADGGLTRFVYGGNAFLYHITLGEYGELLDWLGSCEGTLWMIPSVGPSFGRAMDQAALVRRHAFPCVLALPCNDPRDAGGLEAGLREIADAAGTALILYLKEENNFGADKEAGLAVIARLIDAGICVGVKYAVVRHDPSSDPYLTALLERVDRRYVLSGIGERPAGVHLRQFQLPGFTTGSGCVAPVLSQAILRSCVAGDVEAAAAYRGHFMALEDQRDAWGPARVLHAAIEGASIVNCGPIPPFISALSSAEHDDVRLVSTKLLACEREARFGWDRRIGA